MQQIIEVSSWVNWKALLTQKQKLMVYSTSKEAYDLFLHDNNFVWHYSMYKNGGADQIDFETNYKDTRYSKMSWYSATSTSRSTSYTPQGDILTVQGSDTKIVTVRSIIISAIRTSNSLTHNFSFVKRMTASTGTSIILDNQKLDILSPTASAVCLFYTTAGTSGTLVGKIMDFKKTFRPSGLSKVSTVTFTFNSGVVLPSDRFLALSSAIISGFTRITATVLWTEH